jgi:hypothetical protein
MTNNNPVANAYYPVYSSARGSMFTSGERGGAGRGSEYNPRQLPRSECGEQLTRPGLLVGSSSPVVLTRLGQMWIEHAQPHAHHDGLEARMRTGRSQERADVIPRRFVRNP